MLTLETDQKSIMYFGFWVHPTLRISNLLRNPARGILSFLSETIK